MSILRKLDRSTRLFVIVFLLVLILPSFAGYYQTRVMAKFVLFGIFAMSLDLLWGSWGF
jgi:urea transport system permease protein